MQQFHNKKDLYFISDTHFGHENIIKFCDRPCKDVEEMNQMMIDAWNNKVPEEGIIFFLGDFSFKLSSNDTEEILQKLNGYKVFLMGNHDQALNKVLKRNPSLATTVKNMLDIKVVDEDAIEEDYQHQVIALCHYPMRAWNHSRRGSWQLFGHEHGEFNNQYLPHQMDVGVDSLYHTYGKPFGEPISYEEVKEIIIRNDLKQGR